MLIPFHIDKWFGECPKIGSPGCIDPLFRLRIPGKFYHGSPENQKLLFLRVVNAFRRPDTSCSRDAYGACTFLAPVNEIFRFPDDQITASAVLCRIPALAGLDAKVGCNQIKFFLFRIAQQKRIADTLHSEMGI